MGKLEPPNSQGPSAVDTPQPFNILIELAKYRRLLTVKEVAEIFGKSECTIYRWSRKKNQMPSLMVCGSRLFDPSTLGHWLEKKEPRLLIAARDVEKRAAALIEHARNA